MEKLISDMKYAGKSLVRSKGYPAAVIMTASACIGVNVAIFAIVNSVLLRPLPVPDSQDIVLMSNRYPKAGVGEQFISSSGDYFDRREKGTVVTGQAGFRFSNENLHNNSKSEWAEAITSAPSPSTLTHG